MAFCPGCSPLCPTPRQSWWLLAPPQTSPLLRTSSRWVSGLADWGGGAWFARRNRAASPTMGRWYCVCLFMAGIQVYFSEFVAE